VTYLREKYHAQVVGLHGVSMGAATVMLASASSDNIDFCIEDCGYSNAYDLFKYRSSIDHNKLVSYLTYPTSLYLKLFYKFDFTDISPINVINKIKCPVLFIHGEEDRYVPYHMVHELYTTFEGKKDLFTIKEAKHANSKLIDPQGYKAAIYKFLDQNNF
jgi:fermentation-respiration switch protein FrsA (DUF1100 family)